MNEEHRLRKVEYQLTTDFNEYLKKKQMKNFYHPHNSTAVAE